MKICEKNADEMTEKVRLMMDPKKDECIKEVNVGCSARGEIKLIEVVTSLQNRLKWQAETESVGKVSSVQFNSYTLLTIKAKLVSTEETTSTSKTFSEMMKVKPKLKMVGLAFNVMEIVKK